jgi:DNA repair protein SbcD/Mre11
MLRLVHTSDWHLGHELHGYGREHEHDAFLGWLLEQLESRDADVLIVTGDIYDVANPPTAAMERLYDFLRQATTRCPGLSIVIIGGNHDSPARINLPAALLGRGRVHLVGCVPRVEGSADLDSMLLPLSGRDGEVAAWLAAVPYCRPGDLGQGDLATLYRDVLELAAAKAGDLPLVVTGHLHLAAGDVSAESERRIVIGGEEAEAADLFGDRPAYVALGHLHRPQAIAGGCTIRYAGSPFPLSTVERDYRHSICLVDLLPDETRVEEVPIPRAVDFLSVPSGGARPIEEVLEELARLEFAEEPQRDRHPFIEVLVLLERPEPGLHARVADALKDRPCRLTRVKPVFPDAATGGAIGARRDGLDELDPETVFAELHERLHGCAPEQSLALAFSELVVAVESEQAE